jgi:hypothetical protein
MEKAARSRRNNPNRDEKPGANSVGRDDGPASEKPSDSLGSNAFVWSLADVAGGIYPA